MRADHGSNMAIEAVYRRRYAKFLRVAVAILRDEQLAEEAVHDAFVRALRHRRSFDERGTLEAWLWSIVVNESRRHHSLERRTPQSPLAVPDDLYASTPNGNGQSDLSEVELMVAALPERQRLALF